MNLLKQLLLVYYSCIGIKCAADHVKTQKSLLLCRRTFFELLACLCAVKIIENKIDLQSSPYLKHRYLNVFFISRPGRVAQS